MSYVRLPQPADAISWQICGVRRGGSEKISKTRSMMMYSRTIKKHEKTHIRSGSLFWYECTPLNLYAVCTHNIALSISQGRAVWFSTHGFGYAADLHHFCDAVRIHSDRCLPQTRGKKSSSPFQTPPSVAHFLRLWFNYGYVCAKFTASDRMGRKNAIT